jgi:hypothetical protein
MSSPPQEKRKSPPSESSPFSSPSKLYHLPTMKSTPPLSPVKGEDPYIKFKTVLQAFYSDNTNFVAVRVRCGRENNYSLTGSMMSIQVASGPMQYFTQTFHEHTTAHLKKDELDEVARVLLSLAHDESSHAIDDESLTSAGGSVFNNPHCIKRPQRPDRFVEIKKKEDFIVFSTQDPSPFMCLKDKKIPCSLAVKLAHHLQMIIQCINLVEDLQNNHKGQQRLMTEFAKLTVIDRAGRYGPERVVHSLHAPESYRDIMKLRQAMNHVVDPNLEDSFMQILVDDVTAFWTTPFVYFLEVQYLMKSLFLGQQHDYWPLA